MRDPYRDCALMDNGKLTNQIRHHCKLCLIRIFSRIWSVGLKVSTNGKILLGGFDLFFKDVLRDENWKRSVASSVSCFVRARVDTSKLMIGCRAGGGGKGG